MKELLYTLIISGTIVLIACSSPSQKVEHAQEDIANAKQELNQPQLDSAADYQLFKKESEEQISKNEKTIDAFKARMILSKKQLKENDQKMIDELEQKNIDMRERIAEYKVNGKDEWGAFKVEFSHDMAELGNAIKDITVQNTN